MKLKQSILGIISTILPIVVCSAEEHGKDLPDTSAVMSFKISYPVNSSEIHPDYMGNARMLNIINEHLQKSARIDSIMIYSSASPEGSLDLNRRLALERGRKAKEYIISNIPPDRHIPHDIIRVKPKAENWDGLKEMTFHKYHLDDRDEVLSILERQDITDEHRKRLLKRLNNGATWQFFHNHIFPELRYASWIAVMVETPTFRKIPEIPVISHLQSGLYPPETTLKRQLPAVKEQHPKTILALKTNLLYDLATLVNCSVEVPLYKDKVSALAYGQFPWWSWGEADNEYCIRFLSLGSEARWWFAGKSNESRPRDRHRDKLTGHFLGIYGESGKYDFQFKDKICYQGEFWSAGLSYGYSTPIGKWLNLEFSISAGYASIPYRGYTPGDDYKHLYRDTDKVGIWHYFGPTKAQISLIVPITAKIKKGGRR